MTRCRELTIHNKLPGLFGETQQNIRVMILPAQSRRLILCLPGYRGSLIGYRRKYLNVAEEMTVEHGIPVVLSAGHDQILPFFYRRNLISRVRATIDFVLESALSICGHESPEVFVLAFSAGAGAISAIAHEYPQIRKVVLLSPSTGDVGDKQAAHGISQFTGDILMLAGSLDILIGISSAKLLIREATKTTSLRYFKVKCCDHAFRGSINHQIFQAAAFDGFCGTDSLSAFPSKLVRMAPDRNLCEGTK